MATRKCPMCLELKNIVDSHLIPRAMYAYLRPPGGHPVAVSDDYVGSSDRQLHDFLLCKECEDILNKGGEAWLSPLLAEYAGVFPFYDLLTTLPPNVVEGKSAAYAAKRNAQIDCDKLTHFAMGVLWKASVHSWKRGQETPMIDLGPHRESARMFLRNESPFPASMALTIGVLPAPVKLTTFEYPRWEAETRWDNFSFYIPGMRFVLAAGEGIDPGIKANCFVRNAAHPIIVTDFSPKIFAAAANVLNSPKHIKKFERLGKKIKPPP
jgi:hypothetical protein